MAMMRLFVRPLLWTLAVTGLYAGAAVMIAIADGSASRAATTERIVTDRHTGLALFGFDPVAYFTEGGPRAGQELFELTNGGVTWRFLSEGNRAAFEDNPAVYAPRFGGHDPVAVAESRPATGHPSVWLVHASRLYMFHSEANRERFAAKPAEIIRRADAAWPAVQRTLSP